MQHEQPRELRDRARPGTCRPTSRASARASATARASSRSLDDGQPDRARALEDRPNWIVRAELSRARNGSPDDQHSVIRVTLRRERLGYCPACRAHAASVINWQHSKSTALRFCSSGRCGEARADSKQIISGFRHVHGLEHVASRAPRAVEHALAKHRNTITAACTLTRNLPSRRALDPRCQTRAERECCGQTGAVSGYRRRRTGSSGGQRVSSLGPPSSRRARPVHSVPSLMPLCGSTFHPGIIA